MKMMFQVQKYRNLYNKLRFIRLVYLSSEVIRFNFQNFNFIWIINMQLISVLCKIKIFRFWIWKSLKYIHSFYNQFWQIFCPLFELLTWSYQIGKKQLKCQIWNPFYYIVLFEVIINDHLSLFWHWYMQYIQGDLKLQILADYNHCKFQL